MFQFMKRINLQYPVCLCLLNIPHREEWQELDLVCRFERDGDKEGFPWRLACVADSRSEVEMDPLIPVIKHSLPKQTFDERRQQQFLPLRKPYSETVAFWEYWFLPRFLPAAKPSRSMRGESPSPG